MSDVPDPDSRNAETVPIGEASAPASDDDGGVARGTQIERYLVLGELGRGGMSVVYRAYDPRLHREVALKLLRGSRGSVASSSGRARLLREAQSMARLAHPNVVPVYDVGTAEGQPYVAMELVDGQDLHQWLQAATRPWSEVLGVFVDAARGLAAAHAAGIVHRDFKPGNVLVGTDGRARVGDFGLARGGGDPSQTESEEGPAAASAAALSSPLTDAGSVMGTPPYMAPEQHAGQRVDAAGDQYAFCVALWEALYGKRPFSGDNDALAEAKRACDLPSSPPEGAAPGWLHRVVLRGLSPVPGDRWPSMNDLVQQLTPDTPARRRSFLLVGASVVAVVAAAVVAQVQHRPGAADQCAQAVARVHQVWNETRSQQVAEAFAATQLPFAASVVERIAPGLDGWSTQWAARTEQTCADTQGTGAARSAAYLRMACLERRLAYFEALVGTLVAADETTVRQATAAVQSLPTAADCDDADVRLARLEAPADAGVAAEVEEARHLVAQAAALQAAGKYPEAKVKAGQALAVAEHLGYRPLRAEALRRLGLLSMQNGRFDQARTEQRDAYFTAVASRHDEMAARAATDLAFSSTMLAKIDEADDWTRHAETIADAAGLEGELLAWLYDRRGIVRAYQARHEQSLADHRKAIEVLSEIRGADDLLIAKFRMHVGIALGELGRPNEARAAYGSAVKAHVRALGESHPDVASIRINYGNALRKAGEHEAAITELSAALTVLRGAYGDDHPHVAMALSNLGIVYANEERWDDAVGVFEEALAAQRASLGPQHPRVAATLFNLGETLRDAGRPGPARTRYEEALAVYRAQPEPDAAQIADVEAKLKTVLSTPEAP